MFIWKKYTYNYLLGAVLGKFEKAAIRIAIIIILLE